MTPSAPSFRSPPGSGTRSGPASGFAVISQRRSRSPRAFRRGLSRRQKQQWMMGAGGVQEPFRSGKPAISFSSTLRARNRRTGAARPRALRSNQAAAETGRYRGRGLVSGIPELACKSIDKPCDVWIAGPDIPHQLPRAARRHPESPSRTRADRSAHLSDRLGACADQRDLRHPSRTPHPRVGGRRCCSNRSPPTIGRFSDG